MHHIRESWVWSYEAIGRNLIIVRVLHSDPRVIVTLQLHTYLSFT